VRFNEVVIVNDRPFVKAFLGKNNHEVRLSYINGSGTETLSFEYVLTKKDISKAGSDTFLAQKIVQLGKARITDASGNNALLDEADQAAMLKTGGFTQNMVSVNTARARQKRALISKQVQK
jgi:hypothetical protein